MKHTKALSLAFFLASLTSLTAAASPASDWQKVEESDGITVSVREQTESPVIEVLGETDMDSSVLKIASVIFDSKRAQEWADNLKETRLLHWITDDAYISYNHIGLPLIIKDRDFLISNQMEFDKESKTFWFRSKSISQGEFESLAPSQTLAPKASAIRGQILSGSFAIKEIGPDKSHVRATLQCDPMGQIPKWLVNTIQKTWPFAMFKGLRQQAGKSNVSIDPAIEKIVNFKTDSAVIIVDHDAN